MKDPITVALIACVPATLAASAQLWTAAKGRKKNDADHSATFGLLQTTHALIENTKDLAVETHALLRDHLRDGHGGGPHGTALARGDEYDLADIAGPGNAGEVPLDSKPDGQKPNWGGREGRERPEVRPMVRAESGGVVRDLRVVGL